MNRTAFNLFSKRGILRAAMVLVTAAIVVSFAGCATFDQPRPEPVTVPQIIAMAKKGMPAQDIIAKMKASRTVYRLKATRLARLEKEGVPGKVIDYMQKTYIEAVRRNTRFRDQQYWSMEDDYGWYGGVPFGWPDRP